MLANRMESAGNETPSTDEDAGLLMQQQAPSSSFQPTVVSISVSSGTTGEIIGNNIQPEMEFVVNDPVFIKATL